MDLNGEIKELIEYFSKIIDNKICNNPLERENKRIEEFFSNINRCRELLITEWSSLGIKKNKETYLNAERGIDRILSWKRISVEIIPKDIVNETMPIKDLLESIDKENITE